MGIPYIVHRTGTSSLGLPPTPNGAFPRFRVLIPPGGVSTGGSGEAPGGALRAQSRGREGRREGGREGGMSESRYAYFTYLLYLLTYFTYLHTYPTENGCSPLLGPVEKERPSTVNR